jgi:hypothetical protein
MPHLSTTSTLNGSRAILIERVDVVGQLADKPISGMGRAVQFPGKGLSRSQQRLSRNPATAARTG